MVKDARKRTLQLPETQPTVRSDTDCWLLYSFDTVFSNFTSRVERPLTVGRCGRKFYIVCHDHPKVLFWVLIRPFVCHHQIFVPHLLYNDSRTMSVLDIFCLSYGSRRFLLFYRNGWTLWFVNLFSRFGHCVGLLFKSFVVVRTP